MQLKTGEKYHNKNTIYMFLHSLTSCKFTILIQKLFKFIT